ncbi:MAG: MFS transporter [Saprospiraceae bacterium]|nr:MFS transporter [Saprospiraceae bacterium]
MSKDNAAQYPNQGYAWYVVSILTLAYISSFIDRQILALLVEPIKADFNISDTQMSLLIGMSFALFYTLMGLPIGRMVDSKNRRNIISIGIAVWSIMTALGGMVRNFAQFFLARIGVGIGEATLSPAAYSIITDYFPKEKRATAIGFYSMGIFIGASMAYLLGGWIIGYTQDVEVLELPILGAVRPWQFVFIVLGLPGLLIALLVLSIREPARRTLSGELRTGKAPSVPLRVLWSHFKQHGKTYLYLNLGIGSWSILTYGSGAWEPTFLIRTFDYSIREAGVLMGVMLLTISTAGVFFGGWIADRWLKKGQKDAKIRAILWSILLSVPTGLLYPLFDNETLMLISLGFFLFLTKAPIGLAAAAIQEITPNEMRGQASAVYLFFLNLIGLGLGPTAVALLTDYAFQDESMLRYSIFIIAMCSAVLASFCFWRCLAPYRRSVEQLESI